jgi:hypothetical protein
MFLPQIPSVPRYVLQNAHEKPSFVQTEDGFFHFAAPASSPLGIEIVTALRYQCGLSTLTGTAPYDSLQELLVRLKYNN